MARPQTPSSPREAGLSRRPLATPVLPARAGREDTHKPLARAEVSSASVFLVLLLLGDLAFVAIHVLWLAVPAVEGRLYALDYDRGHAEFYQYVKMLWIMALFAALIGRTRAAGYAAWIVLFGFLLLDDAMEIHETLGVHVAQALPFAGFSGVRPEDFGEAAVSGTAGVLLLALLAWFYARGSAAFRRASRHIVLLLLALAFFGIGVDMLHSLFRFDANLEPLLGMVEDGGEMLVMSLAVWYVFLLHRSDGDFDSPLPAAMAAAARQARTLAWR